MWHADCSYLTRQMPSYHPETTMKAKLQPLDLNDIAVLLLAFGLLVGLAIK